MKSPFGTGKVKYKIDNYIPSCKIPAVVNAVFYCDALVMNVASTKSAWNYRKTHTQHKRYLYPCFHIFSYEFRLVVCEWDFEW